jgi:hypothetical protein
MALMRQTYRSLRAVGRPLKGAWGRRAATRNPWSDYEAIIGLLNQEHVADVPGDVLEIGAFVGAGSRLLGDWANAHNRRLITVDIFDPRTDGTVNANGDSMRGIYNMALGRRSQWYKFAANVEDVAQLTVIKGDSMSVSLGDATLCFAFIDGHHATAYVISDAELAWRHLSPGGWIGFDDYHHDLPQVDEGVDTFLANHASDVAETTKGLGSHQLYVRRARPS